MSARIVTHTVLSSTLVAAALLTPAVANATAQLVAAQPVTAQPATAEAVAAQPATAEAVAAQPATAEAVAAQPATAEPATAQPATAPQPVAAQSSTAQPATGASIAASLLPDRLGAQGALRFTVRYGGGTLGVPAPVRRSVWRLPAGLSLEIPSLRSCSMARLRARGASGCPPQSQVGSGHALAEVHAGSQTLTENIKLWIFVGPLQDFGPSFEILGQGYTPFEQRTVFSGTVLPDHAPYGEDLVMSVPSIPTLPLEPDASIVTLSLTVGTNARHRPRTANTVLVPASCPTGGFPFAAEFTYADGSHDESLATVPCPR